MTITPDTNSLRIDALHRRVSALEDAINPSRPAPPDELDPPVAVPPPAGLDMMSDPGNLALRDYIRTLPFARLMPAFPFYLIPTEQECDWIIEGTTAKSQTRGVESINGQYPMARAYEASRLAGVEGKITFGVKGNIGQQMIGYGYGHPGYTTLRFQGEDIDVDIVGLDDEAEMRTTLGGAHGFIESIRFFNIGLRGGAANFVVATIGDAAHETDVGDVVFDGCAWLNDPSWSEGDYAPHTSGLHLGDHRSLILRRHRYEGFRGREHCLYDKSSSHGPTWIVQNDMKGGNRTWFQRRPDPGKNIEPVGDFCVLLNEGDSYGWDHGDDGSSFAGGSAITVWTCPMDRVFIAGNTVRDAKYGCLMLGAQPPSQGNFLNAAGFPIREAWIWDNYFDNSHTGHPVNLPSRSAVAITSVQHAHLGPNTFANGAELVLDNEWGMNAHGIKNGKVTLYGEQYAAMMIQTYRDTPAGRLVTGREKEAMTVPLPPTAAGR